MKMFIQQISMIKETSPTHVYINNKGQTYWPADRL